MIRVTSCCGCCHLKIGLLVYGGIALLFNVFAIYSVLTGSGTTYITSDTNDAESKSFDLLQRKITAVSVALGCLILILALVGVAKEKPRLLIPNMVALVLDVVLSFIYLVWSAITISPLALIAIALYICPKVYVFICFWSFYKDLTEKQEQIALPPEPMMEPEGVALKFRETV